MLIVIIHDSLDLALGQSKGKCRLFMPPNVELSADGRVPLLAVESQQVREALAQVTALLDDGLDDRFARCLAEVLQSR